MASVSELTLRVQLRPHLTLWDAIVLRIAGKEVRDAYVRLLDAGCERINSRAHLVKSQEAA